MNPTRCPNCKSSEVVKLADGLLTCRACGGFVPSQNGNGNMAITEINNAPTTQKGKEMNNLQNITQGQIEKISTVKEAAWYNQPCHSHVRSAFFVSRQRAVNLFAPRDCDKHWKQQVSGFLHWRHNMSGNDEIIRLAREARMAAAEAEYIKISRGVRFAKPKPETKYLYFIQCGDAVKIGISGSPSARLEALATGAPGKLYLIAMIEKSGHREKECHNRLSHLHIHGEWFRYTNEVDELIKEFQK